MSLFVLCFQIILSSCSILCHLDANAKAFTSCMRVNSVNKSLKITELCNLHNTRRIEWKIEEQDIKLASVVSNEAMRIKCLAQ